MIKKFEDVLKIAKERGPKTVAVACAQDNDVLKAIHQAFENGIVKGILIGDAEKIKSICKNENIDISDYEVMDIMDQTEACLKAVELVSSGKAHLLMKGLVDTGVLLKAVLNKEVGLRTGNVLSHVAVFDVPTYHKLLIVTDAAMNIAPDLETKKQILENALVVSRALDIEEAKVAVIAAKEKVNPKMPATVDAGELVKMNEAGEIKGCLVGGPFALDIAVSSEAAKIKGFVHPAAGDADILLCPTIEAGNILYKSLTFLAKAEGAGVIVGTKAPVILTSRADSEETKLNSIALGVLMAAKL
ncbi:MAG: phosphate butyryltransferase [Peptostreptococcaceae bacterium]|nr:phosphate butyryltransferase [Peptostreptococcaceae bacterium]